MVPNMPASVFDLSILFDQLTVITDGFELELSTLRTLETLFAEYLSHYVLVCKPIGNL